MNWDESTWDSGTWDSPSPPPFTTLPSTKKKTKYKTMASNPTPEDRAVLVALAEDLADGCDLHEVAIGIQQNTEAAIRTAITGEANAKLAWVTPIGAVDDAYDDVQDADAAGAMVLKNCRLRLAKLFGSGYSSNWQTAGFPNQSTAVPDSQDGRFTLLDSLRVYFTGDA